MTSAMALDALNPGVQPSAVALLAGYRYFFIHGSSFSPACQLSASDSSSGNLEECIAIQKTGFNTGRPQVEPDANTSRSSLPPERCRKVVNVSPRTSSMPLPWRLMF